MQLDLSCICTFSRLKFRSRCWIAESNVSCLFPLADPTPSFFPLSISPLRLITRFALSALSTSTRSGKKLTWALVANEEWDVAVQRGGGEGNAKNGFCAVRKALAKANPPPLFIFLCPPPCFPSPPSPSVATRRSPSSSPLSRRPPWPMSTPSLSNNGYL
jgi:hypothetical protein